MRLPARPAHGCAWVSGASSGIGRCLALELARRGWRVAATARRVEDLDALAEKNAQIHPFPADVTDRAAMSAAHARITAELGPIGLVIANAGVFAATEAPALDAAVFRRLFDVNVMGAVHMLELTLPDMAARRTGHVHLVSSATGFGGMPTAAAYGATKAALINMAACLKIELERYGVGVSVSTPGFVDTPAQDDLDFPKPFMTTPERAARAIANGVARGGFEVTFPRVFTWMLKAIYALPKPIHIPLVRAATGWDKRPL